MTYLSIFSGIEAASVAWRNFGWTPIGFAEIEKFPSAVLAHHYPDVPNFGDVTKYKEWPIEKGSIDVMVGGSPCQSFSIAGLRGGLEDPRGNLMLTYGAIAGYYKPRYIIWENVAGVLSSNGGRDFGTFLGMLAELGYGFSYRILDAEYCRTREFPGAVPQRRRRVFVVGYLGDWRRAAAVLFESESLRRDPPPSRKSGERVAGCVASRTSAGGGLGTDFDLDGGLQPYEVCGTLQNSGKAAGSMMQQDAESGMAIVHGIGPGRECARSLTSSNTATGRLDPSEMTFLTHGYAVRRLTPTECERLMGFPDNYTRIPWRNKPEEECPDGPRYKALGNSFAVNCIQWIGERILNNGGGV